MSNDHKTPERLLHLQTFDEEAEFIQFLFMLMGREEHKTTAKIIYCQFSGQTVEEFDRRRRAIVTRSV